MSLVRLDLILAEQTSKVKVQLSNAGIPNKRNVIPTSPVRDVMHTVPGIAADTFNKHHIILHVKQHSEFNCGMKRSVPKNVK